MHWYDLLMLAILGWSILQGSRKGMAWQLAPIGSLILGYLGAYPLSTKWGAIFPEATTHKWASMLAAYLVIALVVHLVARIYRGSLERLKISAFDHHLGALFGGVKGALICLMVTFFAVGLTKESRETVLASHSGIAAGTFMRNIEPILPAEVHDFLQPYLPELPADERWVLQPAEPPKTPSVANQNDRPKLNLASNPNAAENRPSPWNWPPANNPPAETKKNNGERVRRAAAFLDDVIQFVDEIESQPPKR